MPDNPNQQGRQMTFRGADGRIVPLKSGLQPDGMKPSNIGAGKAVFASRGVIARVKTGQ
jgi:hypothetical protein